MSRPSRVRALLTLGLFAAAGCQDYNFNPVGHCLIQPGTKRVSLSTVSTADVLFVVDESGSMSGEQEKLATNLSSFIENLNQYNQSRVAPGPGVDPLEPIDFHVAVTTTSVFLSNPTSAECRSDCPTAGGSQVCCSMASGAATTPFRVVKKCSTTSECGGSNQCLDTCTGYLGEKVCCAGPATVPPKTELLSCAAAGAKCGDIRTHYAFAGTCQGGNAVDGTLFPRGDFVGARGATANPTVLHFDKELYGTTAKNKQGFTAAELIGWFEQNVRVGTCGSGQEQALEAARMALEKAKAGQQKDPRGVDGKADWLHPNAKLVLVFVGDEDDCSSPEDAVRGVILSGPVGNDTCVNDLENKQYDVASRYVDYFTSLGRTVSVAFVLPASQTTCEDQSCTVGSTCCATDCSGHEGTCWHDDTCGGQAAGFRLKAVADKLRDDKKIETVVGSICDPNFGSILNRVADIVKPPSTLVLPTQPAAGDITLVRIASTDGETRKTCRGPAPADLDYTAARNAGYGWWFTASFNQVTAVERHPVAASKFIFINHETGNCEANPGEMYSADYLGRLPEAGCTNDDACAAVLGGAVSDWTCFKGVDSAGNCIDPSTAVIGTCVCGARADVCK
jgi:hypothetical protein